MNLADLNQAPPNPQQATPPPPPPPRPPPKRPSSEPSDVALRSPPRDRRRNQNFNYVNMQKYTKEKPKEPAPPPPPPPPGYSPKKPVAMSPGFSPAKSSKSKKPQRHHIPQKEKEDSSKDDSAPDSTKGKSPAKIHSPSGSEVEGINVDRTHSPLVCFVRLIFYVSFATFHAVLILWCLTVATGLHFIDVEFIEKKFTGHDD